MKIKKKPKKNIKKFGDMVTKIKKKNIRKFMIIKKMK